MSGIDPGPDPGTPPLRRQFEAVAAWWNWTDEDRATWAIYAREHLEAAAAFVRLAYSECQRLTRLGIHNADELLPSIPT